MLSFINYRCFMDYAQTAPDAKRVARHDAGQPEPELETPNFRLPRSPASADATRIASILSAYDELIENNQRRIQILETMARALYREWFVEFRFPGHENVPRVASSIGDIPQRAGK